MNEEDPRQLLVSVVRILQKLKVPYLVTGGIAVLVWGRPRFTADIDIVIELAEEDISKFADEFRKLGSGYIDEDMMKDAVRRSDEFNFVDGATGVKVDFWLWRKNDPFDASRFKRKVAKKILGETIYFISAEDLILVKLKWYKESSSSRQMEDAESIFKISGKDLDMAYLEKWARELNRWDLLKKLMG